jgi:hypothetical protein
MNYSLPQIVLSLNHFISENDPDDLVAQPEKSSEAGTAPFHNAEDGFPEWMKSRNIRRYNEAE